MANKTTWNDEDSWWRDNFSTRPYATGRKYEDFRPGYLYGFEAGQHHMGRSWDEVESDLKTGWDKFEGRGQNTWENVKQAVNDAWHRITGQPDLDPSKMGESSPDRFSKTGRNG